MELPRGTGAKSLKSPLIVAGAQPYRKDTMVQRGCGTGFPQESVEHLAIFCGLG